MLFLRITVRKNTNFRTVTMNRNEGFAMND